MRRIILTALCILLFCIPACAEITCVCEQEICSCFIQLGDEGLAVEAIQNALVDQGWLAPNDDASSFDENTRLAVMAFQDAHDLQPTGTMDDATLTLLLWGMLPEQLDEEQSETSSLPVWIPTDGGIRHHLSPGCSGMYDPRLVSQRNALAMGILPCKRCCPSDQ